MNKEKLAKEMMECLEKHNKVYERSTIFDYIDHWYESKENLINILRKHPNWNEDIMTVLFDYDYERDIDGYTYCTALKQFQTLWLKSYIGKPIKLKEKYEINTFYLTSEARNVLGQTHCFHRIVCDNELVFKINNIDIFVPINATELSNDYFKFNTLRNYPIHIITEDAKDMLSNAGIECSVGQKMSRVINKFFKTLGIDKYPEYNSLYAKLADSISPLKITRHTLLSVHPCDYLHMSYGGSSNKNGEPWGSCHNIDLGEYMAGTLSYMLDKTSMILYTVNGTYEENEFWSQHKINRQVFCYDNYALLQSRLYPDHNDTTTIESFRTVVQDIFSKCLEKDNLWVVKISTSGFKDHIKTHTRSKHYKDYDRSGIKHYLSLLKGEEHGIIKIGSNPPCVKCGKLFRNNDGSKQILCDYCLGLQCECCGRIKKYIGNLQEIEGKFYCTNCYHQCEACGEYVVGKPNLVKTATSKCLIICDKCITNKKKYVKCMICSDYIHHYYANKTNNGICFCNTCQQRGFSENNEESIAVNQQNRT